MPYTIEEKSPSSSESSVPAGGTLISLESFTATINNLTDANLQLLTANVCGNWDGQPPLVIPPKFGHTISTTGSFSNPACGSVSYRYTGSKVPGHPVFTLTFSVPSLGPNHITWIADPGLQIKKSGDSGGYHPNLTFDLTLG
jgi:hypothetical protein